MTEIARDSWTPPEMTKILWALSGLMLILFAVTNLPWELDGYDQAKQAWTSYEMVTEGHWFYQRTSDDQGLATKPPLTGWMSAAVFLVTRSWDIAWRLPPFLCAAAIAFLLFRSASRASGMISGVIAFAAFGFNLLTPRLATLVRSDMPLALVIFAIGLLIWKKISERAEWSTKDRQIMFALLTAGMLIKGPIIYAFLLPGMIAMQWIRRRDGGSYNVWFGWWPWIASLAIFLVWVIAGCLWIPRFYELVVVREFLARFGEMGTHVHRAQPLFFYIPHLLHKFLPWSAVMIALAIVDLRERGWSFRTALKEISPETIWLICWSFGGLIVMSVIPSKRVDRIFPIIPPLCLLVATQAAPFLRNGRPRALKWAFVTVIAAILLSGGYAAGRIVSGYRDHRDALSIFGREVRDEAAKNNWRYEAVGSADEGLPLYLARPHFLKPDVAIMKWKNGEIDALAVPANQVLDFTRELHEAKRRFESVPRKSLRRPNYVLLTR